MGETIQRDVALSFEWEFAGENAIEGRECSVDCGGCREGVELSGSITLKYKAKLSFPLGGIMVGPVTIDVKAYGGGEGGGKFSDSWKSCSNSFSQSGCGYIRANGGLQACAEVPPVIRILKVCIKGEGYWRKNWCKKDGKDTGDSCIGARASVQFCSGWPFRRCRDYILIDINNCGEGEGDEGGG